jgi:hypothetical protein
MASQVQYRRGTNAQNIAFTGALAEITVDTTNGTLRVHDGFTPGGSNVATVSYVTAQIAALSANSITDGTSNVKVYASGNVATTVAGTANVLVVNSGGAVLTGNISATSNVIVGSAGNTQIYMFGANTHIDNNTSAGNIAFRVNTGNGATTTLRVLSTGGVAFANDLVPISAVDGSFGNNIGNIGNATSRFLGVYANTVFSRATSAQYADLAERYVADADYAPGTVLSFGGNVEVTLTSADSDRRVAGVVSSHPSYIMNSECAGEFVATVALTGRVPTSVTGTVRKGDLMVSAGNGVARAEADPRVGTVIGKALADSEGDATIEVVVGRF